jgi:hypothetical protein
MTTKQFTLYRAYGLGGELLWVGVTGNFAKRKYDHEHAGWSPWVKDVVSWNVDTSYPTKEHALESEAIAIRTERPKYNKHYPGEGFPKYDSPEDRCKSRKVETGAYGSRSWRCWLTTGHIEDHVNYTGHRRWV